jgi:hypothetical protein
MGNRWWVLGLALLCAGAQAQVVYRCGNTFSQTPCGADAKVIAESGYRLSKSDERFPPSRTQNTETEQRAITLCIRKVVANLKRAEGTRFVGPERGSMAWIEKLDGTDRRAARIYTLWSYGAIDGKRRFRCVFNLEETEILALWSERNDD